MKETKKILSTIIVILAITLILATPALADQRTLVCDGADECRIHIILGEPATYPAGEPFYIFHSAGYLPPNDLPVATGHMGFALEVDGEYIEPDWDFKGATGVVDGVNTIWSGSVFNFPEGLDPGPHTFTGHWYSACLYLADPVSCETPMEPVDFSVRDLVVIFE